MLRSGQQTVKQSAEELFIIHKQLARRFMWHQKLFMASRVALVVAVVGLLIYVLFAHRLLLQLSPLAFLVALLIPNRGGEVRALEHIDADIGLSYRTALEYENNKAKQDAENDKEQGDVDFSSLLLKRAAYRVRNLDIPDLQPWWLPMLVTSIVLSLVPFFLNATPLNFGGQGLVGNNSFQNPFNQPPQNQEPLQEEQASAEEDVVDELAEEEASDFETQNQDDADLEVSFEDNSQQPDRKISETDSETLSRFLDNLKEKSQENLSEQSQQSSNRPSSDSEGENPEEAEQQRSEEEGREQGDYQENTESTEPDEQSSGEVEGGQEQDEQAGGQEQEEGEEQAGAQRDGENGGEEAAQEGVRPEEAGRQLGQEDASLGSEDNENGIGTGASEPTPSSEQRLQGQTQAPELLEGEIRSDETTIAGEARLPGSDQIDIPGGTTAQEFDRAVERAIAEGRIPVEYQEILKNYFR